MRLSNNKGIALFLSIMLLLLLSVGAAVVLLTVYNYAITSEEQVNKLKATVAAESGINYAYWKLRTDPTYISTYTDQASADNSQAINGYTVNIWIDSTTGRNKINCKVTY